MLGLGLGLGLVILRLLLLVVHACRTPLLALNGPQLQFPPILVCSLYHYYCLLYMHLPPHSQFLALVPRSSSPL